jgi:hypothetical protein
MSVLGGIARGSLGNKSLLATVFFVIQLALTGCTDYTPAKRVSQSPPAVESLQLDGTLSTSATTGVSYSSSLQAHGGATPYSWRISSGQLPAGITLSSATGEISGAPTSSGRYTFTLQVSDSGVVKQTAAASLTITVTAALFDSYGGLTSMPSPNPSTGIFRTEKFGNKWMFVDPANNAFFVIAPYVLAQSTSNDDLGSNYYARTTAKYGDPGPTWGTAQLKRIQAWGFNTVGPYGSTYVLPTSSDSRWATADHTNPVKLPFITMVRPAYYAMIDLNNWGPQPVKNMFSGVSPYYRGFIPGSGVADYFDQSLTTFLDAELANDPLLNSIQQSPYRQYLIGVHSDDSDETYGFGKGPDFPGGYNNAHLGWVVLTMSPQQTANAQKKMLYPDSVVYSKKALRDQAVSQYGTIAALNAAWGSSYTTFDSSGVVLKGEVVGAGNGSTTTFTKTLAKSAVTKFSVQILVGGQMVAGDLGDGTIWGPNAGGTINYETGELKVTVNPAPVTAASVAANYVQNGWGIGSGLMDEDGRSAHQSWTGIDFTLLSDTNASLKTDLDNYLYQIAAHYFSMCKTAIDQWIPGAVYLGPDSLGTWGAPSNRNVLKAAGQYIDVMTMGGSSAMTQEMLDFIYTYYGDKPFSVGEYRTANGDSAFFRYPASSAQTDFASQPDRGQSYYNAVTQYPDMSYTANGSRPYVGILWWQYLDNLGEKNDWGLVSLSDNAYDGHEAVTGSGGVGVRSIPCSSPLESYLCGGEERNYGNLIELVTGANRFVLQGVQK